MTAFSATLRLGEFLGTLTGLVTGNGDQRKDLNPGPLNSWANFPFRISQCFLNVSYWQQIPEKNMGRNGIIQMQGVIRPLGGIVAASLFILNLWQQVNETKGKGGSRMVGKESSVLNSRHDSQGIQVPFLLQDTIPDLSLPQLVPRPVEQNYFWEALIPVGKPVSAPCGL